MSSNVHLANEANNWSLLFREMFRNVADQGPLVACLLLVSVGFVYAVRYQSKRNDKLVDTILDMNKAALNVIAQNSSVIAEFSERLETIRGKDVHHKED